MSSKRLVELEKRTMRGIRIGQQDRVRQVRTERVGIRDRNHLVMDSIYDERGLRDFLQSAEPLSRN